MVVVSGNWVKNVASYSPSSTEEDMTVVLSESDSDSMTPKAVLICRPNSHHFQVRTVSLDQPVKIGRSVARAKPAPNNAIFDCKVLSRHHALLWYENGKFFLQDTKSSNGTFVNNNRLNEQNQEVSSGDIVQFGVDVVENNKKVTHGCIIATLKLYLPDGKEAKASPSINEGDRHGMVPLDDLYKLSQIIQEANQREQCLETKLNALQNVVEETKKSAEESWQAYVGEERLLSRLSALETQLQQASKNWSEDRVKDEISKLRESNEQYQEAAKAALEKVHSEKLEAVNLAIEQERSKISAQQDALLAKEQLAQAQSEIQEIAQKLFELESRTEEEQAEHAKQIRELELHLEEEEAKVAELKTKLYEFSARLIKAENEQNDRPELILNDDLKNKEDMLMDNDSDSVILNKAIINGFQEQNHISLVVAPVEETCEKETAEEQQCEWLEKNENEDKETRRVSFILPEKEFPVSPTSPTSPNFEDSLEEKEVDSKTLKYQYQSAQKEQHQLRLRIQQLEDISNSNKQKIEDLEQQLNQEKDLSGQRLVDNETLRNELVSIEEKFKESLEENQQLQDRVNTLLGQLETNKAILEKYQLEQNEKSMKEEKHLEKQVEDVVIESKVSKNVQNDSVTNLVSLKEMPTLEDELFKLKEKYAHISDEKSKLQQDLLQMTAQYNKMVDRIQNKFFFYIAPLIFIVIYLLINAWFS